MLVGHPRGLPAALVLRTAAVARRSGMRAGEWRPRLQQCATAGCTLLADWRFQKSCIRLLSSDTPPHRPLRSFVTPAASAQPLKAPTAATKLFLASPAEPLAAEASSAFRLESMEAAAAAAQQQGAGGIAGRGVCQHMGSVLPFCSTCH